MTHSPDELGLGCLELYEDEDRVIHVDCLLPAGTNPRGPLLAGWVSYGRRTQAWNALADRVDLGDLVDWRSLYSDVGQITVT